MKFVRWKRFTWNFSHPVEEPAPLPGGYIIRSATKAEEEIVQLTIHRAFALDTTWGDALKGFEKTLAQGIERSFAKENIPALVVLHGPRIIAASAISTIPDAESNLLSGPCVSLEYRNRGMGSWLLAHTLRQLQHSGLDHAHGITRDPSIAGKYIYPKFGSTSTPCQLEAALAAV